MAEPAGGVQPADPMALVPGQPLLRRYRRGPNTSWLQACQVVSVDGRGVIAWLPVGAGFAFRERQDGSAVRAAPIADFASARLRLGGWQGRSALILMPAGRAHSVWWFSAGADFSGWYVNLEARSRFWRLDGSAGLAGPAGSAGWSGVDVTDHELDIMVAPDLSWQWKDEDDLAAVTGLAGYWDAHRSAEIRAEGERVLTEVEAGRFPFDGSWCDFRPDASWPQPRLPEPLPDFEWPG